MKIETTIAKKIIAERGLSINSGDARCLVSDYCLSGDVEFSEELATAVFAAITERAKKA